MTVIKYDHELTDEERKANIAANNLYHQYYKNHLYAAAILSDDGITNRSNEYCNELTDQALAICGNPHYQIVPRELWDDAANAYLDVYRNAVRGK